MRWFPNKKGSQQALQAFGVRVHLLRCTDQGERIPWNTAAPDVPGGPSLTCRKNPMIKLSVMYPYLADARFDHDYYRDVHLPMLKDRMGGHLLYYTIEKGLGGVEPGTPPAFIALCHLYCASVEALMAGVGPHAAEFGADVVNFTDIVPVQQISEVVVERSA
jgi:uncharacterized protein (TIGR02118 family)